MEFILILKKINNTLSDQEKIEFYRWYSESKRHRDFYLKVKNNKDSYEYLFNEEKNWSSIEKKIRNSRANIWKYYAAASIALLFSAAYFFNPVTNKKQVPVTISANKVENNKTILTLSDGGEVVLEENQSFENSNIKSQGKSLAYKSVEENGSETEEIKIEYNYLTVQRGGEFSLILEDGTKVWLNSKTKLKYPVNFIKGKPREVELVYGEAYFEVSPSKNHSGDSFKVINSFQKINVLGTHFNVKAYPEEDEVLTTLVEGKVMVESKDSKIYLKPNQQLLLNKINLEAEVKEVNANEEIAWIRGYFNFNNTSLEQIARVLERWYDVDITIENKQIGDVKFNGVLRKKQDIHFVLKAITNTSNVTYEINNRNIKFKK